MTSKNNKGSQNYPHFPLPLPFFFFFEEMINMVISLFYLNYSVIKHASSLAVLLRANLKEPHFTQGTKHPSFSSFYYSESNPAWDAGSPQGSQSHM